MLDNLHFPEPDSDCVLLVPTLNETTIMQFIGPVSRLERNVHVGYVKKVRLQEPSHALPCQLSNLISIIKSWLSFAYLKCCTDDNTMYK